MKTILLLEDQQLIRESWKIMLDGQVDFKIIAEATELDQAKTLLLELKPDIILTGIFLVNKSILPILSSLHSISPSTKNNCFKFNG